MSDQQIHASPRTCDCQRGFPSGAAQLLASGFRWWEGLLCGFVVVLAISSACPYAEMGFIDDWSYVKTAFEYSRTGHFVYNGWATAMLGWQVPWGALFVKLFGYSFTSARLSMLPVDLLSVWLFYAALGRFGLGRRSAVFGALTLGLSPLFVPLAASYMTDVPGLFVILLCLYLCMRAVGAGSDRAVMGWLTLAAATNVAGGTVRQIAWLGALVMVPSTAWMLRRRPHVLVTGGGLWLLSAAGIFACLRWWNQQPYSVPEKILQGPVTPAMAGHLGAELLKALLCMLLLVFPVLAAWMPRFKTLPKHNRAAITILLGVLAAAAYYLHIRTELHFWTMPWLVHVIGSEGIFEYNWDMLGERAVTIPVWLQAAISLVIIGTGAIFLVDSRKRHSKHKVIWRDASLNSWNCIGWLIAPFSIAYASLLLSRGLYVFIYDRYLLGLMPMALLCLLKMFEESKSQDIPIVSYVSLILFSLYGILSTHDLFALNRARIAAVEKVHATGVPRNIIQAGFEFDGWTEIGEVGYVNEQRIQVPDSAYQDDRRYLSRPFPCRMGFDQYVPALNRKYLVVLRNAACGTQAGFSPVRYAAWLPPFERFVYINQVPQLPESSR